MRNVITVNLHGRAYQLEEQGGEKLRSYLSKAEKSLADNPDKTEIISDIEQAIAEKCDRLLKATKNVVTAEEISTILHEMGDVEGDDADARAKQDKNTGGKRPKRLYTIREGAVFMGVCRGLGAYFGVDPNIFRAAFVILTIFSHGFWVLLYLALGFFLPEARTDTEKAEAFGDPVTAQDIIERANKRMSDPETVQRFSQGFTQVSVRAAKVAMQVISIAASIVLGILTTGWLWLMWRLALGGYQLYDQVGQLNGWRVMVFVTLAYLLVAIPVFVIARLFDRAAELRPQEPQSERRRLAQSGLGILWGVALVGLVGFVTAYGSDFRNYVRHHGGNLDIGDSHICVDEGLCGSTRVYQY